MAKWVYMVETNCKDPKREGEFIKWYTTMHLPDLCATPGFTGAQLYMNTDQKKGQGKFIAVYRIESNDIKKTMAARHEQARRPGRGTDILEVVSQSMYQEVPCPP